MIHKALDNIVEICKTLEAKSIFVYTCIRGN